MFKNFYIHRRFFWISGVVIFIFILGFPFPFLFPFAQSMLVIFFTLIVVDGFILFNSRLTFECERTLPKVMSLGNDHVIASRIKNNSGLTLQVEFLNEIPFQFQQRSNVRVFKLSGGKEEHIKETLRPVTRGEYLFGKVKVFISSRLSLIERCIPFDLEQKVPVYPSIADVKKFELVSSNRLTSFLGIKKTRKLGQSHEFEQISEYHPGDNYQSMNWKATGKTGQLMVNKFTDEKSQPVYSLIDKSRYMKMPFNGMSLLDYAINASLIISNTALKKEDKAGLITFSDKVETFIKAENKRNQIGKVLYSLYKESETKIEANYELMYTRMRQNLTTRSLVFLFSNFDSDYSLERVLPVLRKINKIHLLIVIVFENTELEEYRQKDASDLLDVYNKTIAHKVNMEKKQIISKLKQHSIQVVHTKPEGLSINVLNKYLELKSRGMI